MGARGRGGEGVPTGTPSRLNAASHAAVASWEDGGVFSLSDHITAAQSGGRFDNY